jgi:hypothetical protein
MKTEHSNIVEEPQEYTYHRHSEEKSTIYFRCSDKNCKARVLFSKETCRFTMKNRHLSPSTHKPNSRKAITGQQMAKIATLVRGPISLAEIGGDTPMLFSNDSFQILGDTSRDLGESKELALVKVFQDCRRQAKTLCKEMSKSPSVLSVNLFESVQGECIKYIVEIECFLKDKERIRKTLSEKEAHMKIETFRKI